MLYLLGMKTKNIADIVDRQAPVFQSPAKTKEFIYQIIMKMQIYTNKTNKNQQFIWTHLN